MKASTAWLVATLLALVYAVAMIVIIHLVDGTTMSNGQAVVSNHSAFANFVGNLLRSH